jgi:hypothetical protein
MSKGVIVSPANRGVQVVVTDEQNVQLLVDNNRGINLEVVPQPRIDVLVDKAVAGPQGPEGPQGPQGNAATIAAGTTTTGAAGTNATVTNTGTSSAAVFDFTIPRGDTGETGATGAGVASGGTTGQVLVKASNVNYDTAWSTITGTLSYQGSWNAATNTPALASSVGTNGYYYVVGTAGSTNLNGITDWVVGDWAIFNGSIWQKIDNTDLVSSVNGQTGVVVLTASSVGALAIANNLSDVANAGTARTNLGLGTIATQDADAVAITGGTIDDTVIGSTTPAAGTFTTLTATGQTSLGGTTTTDVLRVYRDNTIAGSTASFTAPALSFIPPQSGYGAGILRSSTQLFIATGTTAPLILQTASTLGFAGSTQAQIAHTASAVNFVQVTGAATGGRVSLSAQGSDANVGVVYNTKGAQNHVFQTNSGNLQFVVANRASTVNWVQAQGNVTGSPPSFTVDGSDTNINFALIAKGTGTVQVGTASSTGTPLAVDSGANANSARGVTFNIGGATFPFARALVPSGSGGAFSISTGDGSYEPTEQFRVARSSSSAVNYVQVTGAATGGRPTISAQGSDTNVGLTFIGKGNARAAAFFNNSASTSWQLSVGVAGATNAVNFLDVSGSAAGAAPVLSAQGSDTNISQVFQSKGTGAIDLAAGSSGVNISNGGTVTALTVTGIGGGTYTSIPSVAISAPTTAGGVQATAAARVFVWSVSIGSGGTGYTVGNVLTLQGGTQTIQAQVTVASVSGGVITGITNGPNNGSYTVLPTNPATTTGGTGTGATINITAVGIAGLNITNAGSGYVEQPTVTFSGGGGSGAAAYASVGSGTTIKSLHTDFFIAGPGSSTNIFRFGSVGNAVNNLFSYNNTSGANPVLRSIGSDTNVGFDISSQGTGNIRLLTNAVNQTQFQIAHTASAVNYVQVTGAATGNNATISAQGSDSNVGLTLQSKGTFGFQFRNSSNGIIGSVTHGGSSTPNYIQLGANIAGQSAFVASAGSDTNIDLTFFPKGTGNVRFGTYTGTVLTPTGYVEIKDAGGTIRRLLVG